MEALQELARLIPLVPRRTLRQYAPEFSPGALSRPAPPRGSVRHGRCSSWGCTQSSAPRATPLAALVQALQGEDVVVRKLATAGLVALQLVLVRPS